MITISAFRWVPDFARGQVRDLRARWALEEAGLPYRTRLLEQGDQDKPAYRALQPFGQVPILEEDRRSRDDDGVANPRAHRHRHERRAPRTLRRTLHRAARLRARARGAGR
jgi:glutathione S-transferase